MPVHAHQPQREEAHVPTEDLESGHRHAQEVPSLEAVLRLQRTAGNAAVSRAIARPTIQRFTDASGRQVASPVVIETLGAEDILDLQELIWTGTIIASPDEKRRLAARAAALRTPAPAEAEPEEGDELAEQLAAVEKELSLLMDEGDLPQAPAAVSEPSKPTQSGGGEGGTAASEPPQAEPKSPQPSAAAPPEATAEPTQAEPEVETQKPKRPPRRREKRGGGGGASDVGSIFASLGITTGVGKAPPAPAAPATGLRLQPTMVPFQVQNAIRAYTTGMRDETGASIVRSWTVKDRYVSKWDRPGTTKGGMGPGWGFSTSYRLDANAVWVIHVHRDANGRIRAGNVQAADLEGELGVQKESLGRNQLVRIGIPEQDQPSDYVTRRWLDFGYRPQ